MLTSKIASYIQKEVSGVLDCRAYGTEQSSPLAGSFQTTVLRFRKHMVQLTMEDELIVIHSLSKTADCCMIQGRRNPRYRITLAIITLNREAIGAIYSQINDSIHRKWRRIAG